jgi:hypothetical protein
MLNPFPRPNEEHIIHMDGLVDKRPQTHDQKKTDYDAGMRGHPGFLRRHRFGFSVHRNAANVISELTSRQSSEG